MKGVEKATRRLCNEGSKKVQMVNSKNGRLLTKEGDDKARWQEHFTEVLNRLSFEVVPEVDKTNVVTDTVAMLSER